MEWKQSTAQYTSGRNLFLGKWSVASCYYDSGRSREDPNKYAATCSLPGIKNLLGHFDSQEKAEAKAEAAVRHWIGNAGI